MHVGSGSCGFPFSPPSEVVLPPQVRYWFTHKTRIPRSARINNCLWLQENNALIDLSAVSHLSYASIQGLSLVSFMRMCQRYR